MNKFKQSFVIISIAGVLLSTSLEGIKASDTKQKGIAQVELAANTFVVNSTNDYGDSDLTDYICDDGTGHCTLRAAIEQANYSQQTTKIYFNIPGEGPHFIQPQTPLPAIKTTIEIYGYSQPGSQMATDNVPAVYQVILDGSLVPIYNIIGLDFRQSSSNSKVFFMKIQNFGLNELVGNAIQIHGQNIGIHQCYITKNSSDGILITGSNNIIGGDGVEYRNIISGYGPGIRIFPSGNHNKVINNFIGTNPLGQYDDSEGWDGIGIMGSYNQILYNLISGYESNGIILEAPQEDQLPVNNHILGNKIGLNRDETAFIPNGQGISINHSDNNIIEQNKIAGNNFHGILMYDQERGWNHVYSKGNSISQNSIYDNNNLGIDLGNDWVTENDFGDADIGPNNLLNFPFIESAYLTHCGLIMNGRIDTYEPGNTIIEFFSNTTFDNTVYGEGEKYIGSALPRNNGSFHIVLPPVPVGTFITATATDQENNTSEFSHYIEVISQTELSNASYDIYIYDTKKQTNKRLTSIGSAREYNVCWSSSGDDILHVVDDQLQSRLAVTNVETSITEFIEGSDFGCDAVWSPNERSVVYDDRNSIYKLNIRNCRKTLLIEDAVSPEFSANGKRLLFYRPSDNTVRTIDTRTLLDERIVAVVNNPDWRGARPSWSPNGKWIVYDDNGIWKVKVNMKGVPKSNPEPVILNGEFVYGDAKFSNNSRKLVLYSSHETGEVDIWTINTDGTDLQRLVGNPNYGDYNPVYSPNGRYVAYAGYSTLSLGKKSETGEVNLLIPQGFVLEQNYPNPFNPTTYIQFVLPNMEHVNITVYNCLGQKVKELVNEIYNAGRYKIEFNANELSSGIYFYRMITRDYNDTKKMIFLK